ncbi:PAS domain-containing methyl-accepting chemotaxis protein [Emcibacteraceae bacterium Y4]|nr:PAS domain-containing methyl-accepting chemotaxis protein [Pseudemcibacter aquimaris]
MSRAVNSDTKAKLDALNRSQAVIEFDAEGLIKTANENFLNAMGYTLDEIKGRHHRMFVEHEYAKSQEYKDFWAALNRGEYQVAEYMRLAKGGREIWIQASYNPILNNDGIVTGVVKFATDITENKLRRADTEGQIAALNKAQAVIHFNLDGTIIEANENFCSAMGYALSEIQGEHHSMFVDTEYADSDEYKEFWASLNRGKYQTAEYKRIAKGGREIWISASYNPIFDAKGRVIKVVKFATDITAQKMQLADYNGQLEAVDKSQAVISFNMDGTIIDANRNFLDAVGYDLSEIKGQHHRLFVDPSFATSQEYEAFWSKLNKGEFQAAEYKRYGKNGKEIWIQATYNPIMDVNGKPFKVVKFASNITDAVLERRRKEQVQKDIAKELASINHAMLSATEQANSAAHSSEETNVSVQAVAAGVEEFDAAITSIADSMRKSRETSDDAFKRSESGGEATKRLIQTAKAMTNIVEMIQDIANQINLLALNATIESARAGEAGRGFAVVANEVKNLAAQAANATDQISSEIHGMQKVSEEVDDNFTAIRDSLNEVRTYVVDSSSAVEQQSAAAREMTGNMQSAASGVSSINVNINEIAVATNQANDATSKVEEMSKSIA